MVAIFGHRNSIQLLNEENLRRFSSLGMAVGEAYSDERQQELYRVWHLDKKALHLSIPHLGKGYLNVTAHVSSTGSIVLFAGFESTKGGLRLSFSTP